MLEKMGVTRGKSDARDGNRLGGRVTVKARRGKTSTQFQRLERGVALRCGCDSVLGCATQIRFYRHWVRSRLSTIGLAKLSGTTIQNCTPPEYSDPHSFENIRKIFCFAQCALLHCTIADLI